MGSCNFIFFSFFISSVSGSNPAILAICHPRRHPVLPGGVNTRESSHSLSSGVHLAGKSEPLISLIWQERHFVWLKGNISVSLNQLYFRCWSEWWWVHSNMLLHRVSVLDPTPRHIQDTHGCCASWVFCQTSLRQDCDTGEPGLQWKRGHRAGCG